MDHSEPEETIAPPGALRWLAVAGLVGGAVALGLAAFRRPVGPSDLIPFDPSFALVLAVAFALASVLLAFGSACRPAAGWFALLLVGQASMLQLTLAGPSIRYQRFQPWGETPADAPLAAAVLLLQVVLVVAGLRTHGRWLAGCVRAYLPGWRLPAAGAACFALGAALSRDVPAYGVELVAAFVLQLVQLLTVILLVRSVPESVAAAFGRLTDRVLGRDDGVAAGHGVDRFALVVAGGVFAVTALLAWLVYQLLPHVQDEFKYLLHARHFAGLRLGFPTPPVPEGFELFLMDTFDHGWSAVTPPGWPAVLAVGEALGAPFLVNPLLSALDVVLAYALLRRLFGQRTARIALLLLATSPWFLFLGMSLMAHQLTFAGTLVGALGVAWVRHTGNGAWALAGGVGLGVAIATRQLDGALAAVLTGLWALGLGGKRISIPAVAGLVLASVGVVALLLVYNVQFTGHPLHFPIMEHVDAKFGPGRNDYGFGPDRGLGWALDPWPGHAPKDAVVNTALNAAALNVELFGWAFGSLWVIVVFVLRGGLARIDRALCAVLLGVVAIYVPNYFSGGPDFGARYWYVMLFPCAVLAAREIGRMGGADDGSDRRPLLGAAALVLASLLVFVPWRALDKYKGYRGVRPGLPELVAPHVDGPTLVLIRGNEVPDWQTAAIENPFDVNTGPLVYAWDRSADVRARLLDAYPDRRVLVLDGPTRTGNGTYAVHAGPLDPAAARALPFAE